MVRANTKERSFDEDVLVVIRCEWRMDHQETNEFTRLHSSGCGRAAEVEREHSGRELDEAVSDERLGWTF